MIKTKTVVVMPTYNAENTLKMTLADILFEYVDEIILVDDSSEDNTLIIANSLSLNHQPPITIFSNNENKGYGNNQKKCYELALKHKADIVVMLHSDYQYDPKLIKYLVEYIENKYFDVMLGSRIRSRGEALSGGMPAYKYFANRFLSLLENLVTGRNLSEWHTGMRAYKREVLENIRYENFSDDFVFDSQMLFSIIEKNYSIGEIPVPVRYRPESSSINFARSIKYGLLTMFEAIKFLMRKFINRS